MISLNILSKNKLLIQLFVLLLILLCLSGCWDREELTDRAIIFGAGIDVGNKDDNINLTLIIMAPDSPSSGQSGGSPGGNSNYAISANGVNVADAITKVQAQIPRKLFWGHTRVVVIGEKLAKKGIRDHIDFFARHSETRLRASAFISKGDAKGILRIVPTLERGTPEMLRELANYNYIKNVTIKKLLQMLNSEVNACAIPRVELAKHPISKNEKKEASILHNGTVILKNGKMIGYLNEKATQGYLFIKDEIEIPTITITPEGEKNSISVAQIKSKTKITPNIHGNQKSITINITSESDIIQNETKINLSVTRNVKKLEKEIEKAIKERGEVALKQLQKELNADILDFSGAFHRKYPKEWKHLKKNWDDEFPEIKVKINVNTFVHNLGMTSPPATTPEDEVKN